MSQSTLATTGTSTDEHTRLLFSTNSLRNCSIQCDALGIHYQLSTPMDGTLNLKNNRITTITRWDPHYHDDEGLGKDIVIAEWQHKQFGLDRIRMRFDRPLVVTDKAGTDMGSESKEDVFVSIDQFFPKTSDIPNFKRTFTDSNGKRYSWSFGEFSLKLIEEGSVIPIAEYGDSHIFRNKRSAHISLAPGYEEVLDYIVVTCVVAERKRRDTKKAALLAILLL